MTPPDFRTLLDGLKRDIGLTPAHLARLFGYASPTSIYQMRQGLQHPAPDVVAWLEKLRRWLETHAPDGRQ